MKLQKNNAGPYVIPPIGLFVRASIVAELVSHRYHYQVGHVRMKELGKMRTEQGEVFGMPLYFALNDGSLYTWPIPDQDYDFTFRYFPEAVEI